jgi:mannose-6-phosphate isomerase-like protein (cupin superfamily)
LEALLSETPRSVVVAPGEGAAYWVLGDLVTFKLPASAIGGKYSVAEITTAPGTGPPPHLHEREDELFAFLDGEVEIVFGDERLATVAGDAVYLPKRIFHAYKNCGSRPAKFLVIATSPGFEQFVAEAGIVVEDPAKPPPVTEAAVARVMQAAPRFGIALNPDYAPKRDSDKLAAPPEYWVLGQHVRMQLGSAETAGNFCLITITMPARSGVGPHRHRVEDELFYVAQGTVLFSLSGRDVPAGPGTFIHVPAGVTHAIANPAPVPAVLIDYHTPGGFERFIVETGTPCTDRNASPPPLDPEKARAAMARYGMEL